MTTIANVNIGENSNIVVSVDHTEITYEKAEKAAKLLADIIHSVPWLGTCLYHKLETIHKKERWYDEV